MIFISTHIFLESINVSLPIGTFLLCSRRAAGLHPRKRYASRCIIWDWKVCAQTVGGQQLLQRPEPMSLASQKFEMQLCGNDEAEDGGGYMRGNLHPRKKNY